MSILRTASLLPVLLTLALAPPMALASGGEAHSPAIAGKGNTTNDSYNHAKRMLERQVYFDHRVTIYCDAPFDEKKHIELPEGFTTPKHENRAARVEWEHAVPAENFGRAFLEWREGDAMCVSPKGQAFRGRRCAELANMDFRYMQADMYNLFPSVGAVNAVRSNKQYAELPSAHASFGSCPAKVMAGRFEPPASAKGQVARAALYMDDAYPRFHLSEQQRRLFTAWDRVYKVDQWECTRAKRIEALQGNENLFVKNPCREAGLW